MREVLKQARLQKTQFAITPVEDIIAVLETVGELWKKGGFYFNQALESLPSEISFSPEMIASSLEMLPQILHGNSLRQRVRADFGELTFLDEFGVRHSSPGLQKFVPHGVLLHVSAGNIFLGAIDSLVNAWLTKNISIIKLSSSNQVFPKLFEKSIQEADVNGVLKNTYFFSQWHGGDKTIEKLVCENVDAVIAWGGGEMVKAYRAMLPVGIPLIEHGPKFSMQVITKAGMKSTKTLAEQIARDVSIWDQSACASPQNLFVEKGTSIQELMEELKLAMSQVPWPRGPLSEDEEVEILKEKHRAVMTHSEGFGQSWQGSQFLLHFDPRPGIRFSPLSRTLIVKEFTNLSDLRSQLEGNASLLQSCGYALSVAEKSAYLDMLADVGFTRMAPIGKQMDSSDGSPHDGRLPLAELGRWIIDDSKTDFLDFANRASQSIGFYREIYSGKTISSFSDLIPIKELRMPLPQHTAENSGYIFSSGGTSGTPKYAFYSHEEFEKTSEMLAESFIKQGLKRGDLCANLFVAGNLWSSFMVIEKALSHVPAVQLPIGGLAETELILNYLQKFKPRALFGLPSMLVELAMRSEAQGMSLSVPMIFYAGEHLTEQGRQTLQSIWKTEVIGSAGYATVDAGPIGYQCKFTKSREYHLFEDDVHMDIVDGEAVITSLIRKEMPVLALKSGDHVEWSSEKPVTAPCACGSRDRKFILHGRVDGQMRIWASRILWQEVESAFEKTGIHAPVIQIVLEDPEIMTIRFETNQQMKPGALGQFRHNFYQCCSDLKATQGPEILSKKLRIEAVKVGTLPHLARTRKVKPIVDKRLI